MLFMTTQCRALDIENVTFDYYISGTLRIKYTGIKKAIIDEARDLLEDEWRSDANTLYNSGQISLSQHKNSMRRLEDVRYRYGLNGVWWERRWYHNLSIGMGGAPKTIQHTVGRTGDIIDLGIAKINENFKFRFKEYEQQITREWKFKFSPSVTGNTTDIISKATITLIFDNYIRGRKFLRFALQVGYSVNIENFVEFRIEIFNL